MATKKRGGQTRTDEKATESVRVLLTKEERTELERRAKRAGKTMSDYIRDRALA